MNRCIRIALLVALVSASLLATGCWDSLPVEARAVVLAMGIDYLSEEPHYEVTLVYPLTEETKARPSSIHSVRGNNVADALRTWHHTADTMLSLAMVTAIVFGSDAANQGVVSHLHDLYAFADLRTSAQVVVAAGTAKELLSVIPPENQRIAITLQRTINRGLTQGDLPGTSLANFVADIVTPGVDPLTGILGPIGSLSQSSQNQSSQSNNESNQGQGQNNSSGTGKTAQNAEDIQVIGAGLWYLDKMIQSIDLPELQHLLLASERPGHMPLQIVLPNDDAYTGPTDHIGLVIERTSSKWKIDHDGELRFELTLSLRLSLTSYQGETTITDAENIRALEQVLANSLSQGIKATMEKVHQLGCDPLGLGQRFRIKYPKLWVPEEWREKLETASFDVKATVQIKNIGLHINRLKPK